MDARVARVLQRLDGRVDVLDVRAGERRNDAVHGLADGPDALDARPARRWRSPASMMSTPSRSSWRAISIFSWAFSAMPGDCSPSRKRRVEDADGVRAVRPSGRSSSAGGAGAPLPSSSCVRVRRQRGAWAKSLALPGEEQKAEEVEASRRSARQDARSTGSGQRSSLCRRSSTSVHSIGRRRLIRQTGTARRLRSGANRRAISPSARAGSMSADGDAGRAVGHLCDERPVGGDHAARGALVGRRGVRGRDVDRVLERPAEDGLLVVGVLASHHRRASAPSSVTT